MSRRLLTTTEVAARLAPGCKDPLAWFYRHRRDLVERHGFPPPVPGCGRRWDPAALDAWLDARLPAGAIDSRAVVTIDWDARLAERGRAIAGSAA